jgi:RNA polymerase sigma factor (TIGR02999 family)
MNGSCTLDFGCAEIPPCERTVADSTDRHHHQVTQLLELAGNGDSHAAAELLPLVYEELRRLARSRMSQEVGGGAGHTLQPTALVHEAYLRLVGPAADGSSVWNSRGHFFGAAALAMRRILVDRARTRAALKRGGGGEDGGHQYIRRVELQDDAVAIDDTTLQGHLLALDDALNALEKYDAGKFQVVMLRYFAGLTIEETAAALGVSPMTVKRDWAFSRAWLRRQIADDGSTPARAEA